MTLRELYDKAAAIREDTRAFIAEFEANRNLILNADVNDRDTYKIVTYLTSDYAHCLFKLCIYSKALTYLDRSIGLWDNMPVQLFNDKEDPEWCELLHLDRGDAYSSTKKTKKAIIDFAWLVKRFPENERYQRRLLNAKLWKMQYIENSLFGIGATAAVMISFIPKNYHQIKFPVLTVAVALIWTSLILDVIKRIKMRKLNRIVPINKS